MQLVDVDTLLGIRRHITAQVVGVGRFIFRGMDQLAVIVDGRLLHPCRRAPRGRHELHSRLAALRLFYPRDNARFVALYRKMLQLIITGQFIIAVPAVGKIACADGQAAERKPAPICRKQRVVHAVTLLRRKALQRPRAQFAEAAAETAYRLPQFPRLYFNVVRRCSFLRTDHHPRIRLCC